MSDTLPTTATSGDSLVNRMIRAARLDVSLYEEVEADKNATSQAAIVVAIVAVASAIGGALRAAMSDEPTGIVGAAIMGIITSLVSWVIWSYLTYFIGTKMFGGTATPGEMLRTIGFASSPGVLNILGFIPVIGPLIGFVTGIWSLVAGVIAVRQALDVDTSKAVLTAVISWVIAVLPFILLAGLFVGLLAAVSS
jgi:hypothetical protein